MTEHLRNLIRDCIYALVVLIIALPTRILFGLRVRGREMIDNDKGYILVAHHRSYWDIPIMAVALGVRTRIQFIARRGLDRNPIFLPLLHLFSTIIDREHFNKDDFRRVLSMMRKERLIGIFPEGTTRPTGEAKSGVIHFARLTDKPFLPVQLKADGPYPPRYPFRFPRITVSIGRAISLSELESEIPVLPQKPSERASVLTEHLMELIDAT